MRRVGALQRTFSAAAGYLPPAEGFEAMHHTPHSSQRARQFEVWSVLRTLGRQGVGDLVRQSCAAAQAVARRLDENGFAVLNDVVLNQVLVRPAGQVSTESLVSEIQSDGRLWCGPTQWQGRSAIRISVSSWKTTVPDALTAADAIIDCAARLRERT